MQSPFLVRVKQRPDKAFRHDARLLSVDYNLTKRVTTIDDSIMSNNLDKLDTICSGMEVNFFVIYSETKIYYIDKISRLIRLVVLAHEAKI